MSARPADFGRRLRVALANLVCEWIREKHHHESAHDTSE